MKMSDIPELKVERSFRTDNLLGEIDWRGRAVSRVKN